MFHLNKKMAKANCTMALLQRESAQGSVWALFNPPMVTPQNARLELGTYGSAKSIGTSVTGLLA